MRQIVSTQDAPAAVGPYSQAVRSGDLLFTAGQVALRPDGSFVGGSVTQQTEQVMKNLAAVLKAAGVGFEAVVKSTCFLTDMADFEEFNRAYAGYFTHEPPARSTVAVAALPKGARVEVELVARLG
ncbi:MAG TPA: RidA family protein [Trueperaceae bacterium]